MANKTTPIGKIEPITEARAPEGIENTDFITSLETYISDAIGVITVLSALFFIIYAFLAAFQWVTSGGDSGKISKSRDRLIWSTLGLVLVVATYSILGLIGGIIGFSIVDFGELIENISPKI